jgi:hypothetical protein
LLLSGDLPRHVRAETNADFYWIFQPIGTVVSIFRTLLGPLCNATRFAKSRKTMRRDQALALRGIGSSQHSRTRAPGAFQLDDDETLSVRVWWIQRTAEFNLMT